MNLRSFLKKIPAYIEARMVYHFLILLVNAYFLIEFLATPIGNRTLLQKFAYLTCLNQVSIVIYYFTVLFYNIKLYVNGYPKLQIKRCPTMLLTYLKTNLSISCFVVIGFWTLKTFYPDLLVPKKLENQIIISAFVENWMHLFNFLFLLVDLIWEKHRKFLIHNDKQIQIFIVIFFSYIVILLGFNLAYGKNVYPFLEGLTFVIASLMGIISVGLLVIIDLILSLVMQELWEN